MDRQALEKMLKQGTDNALLRYTLGALCLKQNDPEAAAEHLAQAVKQDQGHSASWKLYGKALARLQRAEEARQAYQNGIAVADAKGDVQAAKEMRVFLKRLGSEST
ncbi:MAG: tetratricopeptide repeat protein [Candidatus Thiodiazotropha sp. (ex Epidulcina cf. delphinae)]|nr:tetratricopeptide repeat protein [Candidatus Thiodiazotropha sp. (ex Epidulcina cf. delphinae)]